MELRNDSTFMNSSILNNDPTTLSYMDYFHPKFPKFLTIIILVIGDFGNILSLIIFCRPPMRNNSVFIYFAFLAVVDFFVMTLGMGDIIIISYFHIAFRNESIILCRIHTFLTYVFTHLSSFILASVSIDRAIALNSIKLAKKYCKPKTARKIIIFDSVLVLLLNCHSLFFLGFYENSNSENNLNQSGENLDNHVNFMCGN